MSKMQEELNSDNVHYGFTKNRLVAAIVASTAATFLATMFGEWYSAVGWPVSFSFNTLNAEVWATNFKNLAGFFPVTQGQTLSADFTYFLGMWAHYSQGLFFGFLFAFFIYPNFPGGKKIGSNLVKGTLWGLTLVIVSNSFVMPLLYGAGFWFSNWGPLLESFGVTCAGGCQANLAFDNIVWHATYGFLLGMFYSPLMKSGTSMGETSSGSMSGGSASRWGQIILGWIVIILGGWVSTQIAGAQSWGVIVGLIGLIFATGPPFRDWRRSK